MNQREKRLLRQFTKEGLPIDAKAWTEQDWRDLHEAMQEVIRKVSERHGKAKNDSNPVVRRRAR